MILISLGMGHMWPMACWVLWVLLAVKTNKATRGFVAIFVLHVDQSSLFQACSTSIGHVANAYMSCVLGSILQSRRLCFPSNAMAHGICQTPLVFVVSSCRPFLATTKGRGYFPFVAHNMCHILCALFVVFTCFDYKFLLFLLETTTSWLLFLWLEKSVTFFHFSLKMQIGEKHQK